MFLRATFAFLILAWTIANTGVEGSACDSSGIELTATPEVNILQSPGYPENYNNNELCRWSIKAERSYQVVRVKITDMRVQNTAGCMRDFLQIQDGTGAGALTLKRCCKKICKEGEIVTTSEQDSLITFKADTAKTDKGFEIRYWAVTKTEEEISKVKLSSLNYALMGLFVAITLATSLSLLCIHIIHSHPRLCYKIRHHTDCISNKKTHLTNGSVNPEDAVVVDKSFATCSTNLSARSSLNSTVHDISAELV